MKLLKRQGYGITVNENNIADFAFVLFLCNILLGAIFRNALAVIGMARFYHLFSICIIYIPVLVLCIISPRKYIKIDFLILWISVILFLGITLLVHPEYEYWYARETYGVWDYVLRFDNDLYIYLFIRLVNDPKRILRNFKISSWIMYLYLGNQYYTAMKVGYWIQVRSDGTQIHSPYNLAFGYNVLSFALVFLYYALKEKKIIDWVAFGVGMLMIFIAGSRGPLLCVLLFLFFYFLTVFKESNIGRKSIYVIAFIVIAILVWVSYSNILNVIANLLDEFNISSRSFRMLISGNISDDNNRLPIWNAAINMIKDHPLGYGAMGTRHVIGNIIIMGHPHNFILEIFIDYGVILGLLLLVCLICGICTNIFSKEREDWRGIFLIFFGRALQLFISGTYWHNIGFMGCIAVGVCSYIDASRNKRRY